MAHVFLELVLLPGFKEVAAGIGKDFGADDIYAILIYSIVVSVVSSFLYIIYVTIVHVSIYDINAKVKIKKDNSA